MVSAQLALQLQFLKRNLKKKYTMLKFSQLFGLLVVSTSNTLNKELYEFFPF